MKKTSNCVERPSTAVTHFPKALTLPAYEDRRWCLIKDIVMTIRPASIVEISELVTVGFLLTEEEAAKLPVGSLFTGRNGQWYIKIN